MGCSDMQSFALVQGRHTLALGSHYSSPFFEMTVAGEGESAGLLLEIRCRAR
jgi:hypothetical protein